MKHLWKLLLGAMLMLACVQVNAQQIEVGGTVVDSRGETIIGATIKEKGSAQGTVSNAEGHFSLKTRQGATLVVSYIGMKTIEAKAVNGMRVVLNDEVDQLDEVVVIGYGTARKKDLTGSVLQIKPSTLANQNPQTVQDILRGAAGLSVGYNADAKGGGSLNIRGQRSVYTDGNHNSPLLILDGMMFYGELSEINPDDIEQIDVLKDASSAAIYGAKAANGVIIITTKKGQKGKPVVNISVNAGFAQKQAYRDRMSQDEYLDHRTEWLQKNYYGVNPETGLWDAYQSGGRAGQYGYYTDPSKLPAGVSLEQWRGYDANTAGMSDREIWATRLGFMGNNLENFLNNKTTDWEKLSMRTGFRQDYNASVSGASDNSNYYLSIGYLNNQGVFIDDAYKAVRANMKINTKVTKWLELGANVNFQNRSDGNIGMDTDAQLRNSLWADYQDAEGNYVQYPNSSEYSQRGYNYEFDKQYLDLEKGYTVLNTIFNAKVNLPLGLTYQFNAAPRYEYFYDRYFMSRELPDSNPNTRGANREQAKRFDWSLNNTLTWDYTFMKKHHATVTLAQEAEERRYWSDRIEARNILPTDALGFHNTQNGDKSASSFSTNDTHQTADALLGRVQYVYDNRYLLTASVRRDGYSAFGQYNPYAWFPSAALAWTFTNEGFWKWQNIMDYGKLRVSYGKNGNRSLSNPYVALADLNSGAGKMMSYITPDGNLDLVRYLMMGRLANDKLQWEKTSSWNVGFDFSFVDRRLSGSLEFYSMKTTDMIMNQRLPLFTGFGSVTSNLGQVDNSGFELTLNTVNIRQKDLEWTTSFSLSYNKNRIKHLYYEYEDVKDSNGNVVGRREVDDTTNGWFIGHPIGEIWNYKVIGIWQKDEADEAAKYGQVPGDPKVWNNPDNDVYNEDGTVQRYVYNDDDKQFLGQYTAPVRWSMRNELNYKGFSFALSLYSLMGHKSLETMYLNNDDDGGRMTYAQATKEAKEYWTLDNPTNLYARIEAKGPTGAQTPGRIYNRSFVRIDNVSLGYTLPTELTKKIQIQRAKVYANIQNLCTIHSSEWTYGDPETGNMATRVFTLGLNLTF